MALHLEPHVVLSQIAEAVYQKMEAAGIWTDADSKNRILADTVASLELVSIGLTKALGDSGVAEDALSYLVTKGLFDTVAQAEAFQFELSQTLTDHTTAHEEFQLDLTHYESDTATTQDSATRVIHVGKTDSGVSSDLVYTQASFNRFFSDAVSLTETIRVDEPQYFGESLGLQDSATIIHTRVATAILNNMQLNQGTLG